MRLRLFPLLLSLSLGCGAPQKAPAPTEFPLAQRAASPVAINDPGQGSKAEDDSPVPISKSDPSWGSRNALVTLVEFSDFQCPFCARANNTLGALREAYGPEDLRIIW